MSFANIARESNFVAGSSGAAQAYSLAGAQVLVQSPAGRTVAASAALANAAPLYPAGAAANGTVNVACPSITANSVILWCPASGSAALANPATITRTAGAGFTLSTGNAADNAKTLTFLVVEGAQA